MALIRYLLILVALTGVLVFLKPTNYKLESKFTHEEVETIKPYLILDSQLLISSENLSVEIRNIGSRLIEGGYALPTPRGFAILPQARGLRVPIIIQSGGGYVGLGNQLKGLFKYLKSNGLYFDCYVGEAQSMAFNIMLTVCDKVTAKKDAVLMQHRVKYGDLGTTPMTYRDDIAMSKEEASVLGIHYKDWNDLVRGPEDHVFTLEEIKKYKLVDEWIE
jgi:hypothetical protein